VFFNRLLFEFGHKDKLLILLLQANIHKLPKSYDAYNSNDFLKVAHRFQFTCFVQLHSLNDGIEQILIDGHDELIL
jgi:hypothetical protein